MLCLLIANFGQAIDSFGGEPFERHVRYTDPLGVPQAEHCSVERTIMPSLCLDARQGTPTYSGMGRHFDVDFPSSSLRRKKRKHPPYGHEQSSIPAVILLCPVSFLFFCVEVMFAFVCISDFALAGRVSLVGRFRRGSDTLCRCVSRPGGTCSVPASSATAFPNGLATPGTSEACSGYG